ncbi:hypothetical protein MBLNU230_g5310t1 [Neophaeotheca triangularis]
MASSNNCHAHQPNYDYSAAPCQRLILDYRHCVHKYVEPIRCGHRFCLENPAHYHPGLIPEDIDNWSNAVFKRKLFWSKCRDCELRDQESEFESKKRVYGQLLDSGRELDDPMLVDAGRVWAQARVLRDRRVAHIARFAWDTTDWEWVRTYEGQSLPGCATPSPERLAEPGVFRAPRR